MSLPHVVHQGGRVESQHALEPLAKEHEAQVLVNQRRDVRGLATDLLGEKKDKGQRIEDKGHRTRRRMSAFTYTNVKWPMQLRLTT